MKVIDILKSSKQPFPSLEIVPPQNGMSRQELLSTIGQFMEFSPKYINVTCHRDEFQFIQNPDGSFSKHLVRNRVSPETVCGVIMSEYDVEMVPHIICAGVTTEEIESELYNLKFLGINNIMALRGDSLLGEKRFTPTPGGISHADELVSKIKEFNTANEVDFCIGVGGYPEKHYEAANIETDIENLKRKVDAGADYIITQMFFDNAYYYKFVDLCRAAGISVPIIPGLKPISTAKQVSLLPESFSLNIPAELTEEIRKAGDDKETIYKIGENWCISQCKDLIAHGVPAVHFYTMGKARNIIEILKACF
jgi:methylenetetrahydrofolate reductase (NADPH)